jgi:HD-GYP domain-containing protein (c-di-GMP phosphodiesterase class II)
MQPEYQKDLLRFISFFNAAINNIRLYSTNHPQARRHLDAAYDVLTDLFRMEETLTFILIEDDLVVGKEPLRTREPHPVQLISILRENGLERLSLIKGLEKEEFAGFIFECAVPEKTSLKTTAFIKLGKVAVDVAAASGLSEEEAEKYQQLNQVRQEGYSDLEGVLENIKARRPIDIKTVTGQIQELVRGFPRDMNPLHLLAPLETAEDYTAMHMVNVCLLTISQARSLGFKGKHIHQIGIAALLFDIGKLFISDAIIAKPAALTKKERKIIETHTVKGARYIMNMEEVPKLAVLCALEHHRRFDGTGYPVLSEGWEPHIVSQMIAVADAFDAMRSQRAYQDAKPLEEIIAIIKKERAVAFNPLLVDNFLKLVLR